MADVHCPDGSINSAAHFINWVDSRCVPYTGFQMFLFAGGCLLWVVAYALIIRNAFKKKSVDMAVVAVFSNFAWEFVWAFLHRTDMGWFLVWTYRAWWFLDILIVALAFRYGAKQLSSDLLKRTFPWWGAGCILGFGLLYQTFVLQGLDEPIGATTAYICQLILSWTCFTMLTKDPEAGNYSMAVAVLKGYGTAMNTVFMMIHYPGNHFVHVLGIWAFVIDNLYIALLWKRRKAAGLPVLS